MKPLPNTGRAATAATLLARLRQRADKVRGNNKPGAANLAQLTQRVRDLEAAQATTARLLGLLIEPDDDDDQAAE